MADGGAVSIPAGTTANTVVKASTGRLARVLLQAANATNQILIYDNATSASGTVIGLIAATGALGIYDFQMPVKYGITVGGNATNPAMTVSYY